MYFLAEEEKKQLLKHHLPVAREMGVEEDLRGWNWHQPPLAPVYEVKLGVYEVAGQYCPTARDLFLRRVAHRPATATRPMVEGQLFHGLLAQVLTRAKRLIYEQGLADYPQILSSLRTWIEDEGFLPPEFKQAAGVRPNPAWVSLDEKERQEIIVRAGTMARFEVDRIASRIQETMVRQPYINEDALVATAIPVVLEQKLDGTFLGLSPNLSADACMLGEPMVLDLKFGEPRPFHRLTTTGYALVMEAIHEFPVNLGCIVYVRFNGNRLIITRDLHIIGDELRQSFIESRDERMRMIYEEIDPGKPGNCPGLCQYAEICH